MAFSDYLKHLGAALETGVTTVETGVVTVTQDLAGAVKSVLNYIAANPQALKDAEVIADVGLTATGGAADIAIANAAGAALQTIANVTQQTSPTVQSAVQVLQAAQSVAIASGNTDTASHIDNVVNALTANISTVPTTASSGTVPQTLALAQP
jgi:hypothetical protein